MHARASAHVTRARARSSGRGGRRKGAGRKAGALPQELLDRLGPDGLVPPTDDPLGQARWYTNVLGLLSSARLQGISVTAIDKLAKEIRANAGAAGKVIPQDIMFTAGKLLRDDEDDLASDDSPDEEDFEPSATSPSRAKGV